MKIYIHIYATMYIAGFVLKIASYHMSFIVDQGQLGMPRTCKGSLSFYTGVSDFPWDL